MKYRRRHRCFLEVSSFGHYASSLALAPEPAGRLVKQCSCLLSLCPDLQISPVISLYGVDSLHYQTDWLTTWLTTNLNYKHNVT